MLNKSPLWKNIGKQDSLKEYQSSISSSGSRPIKTFHITFEDDKSPKSESQMAKKNKNTPFPQPQKSIIEEQQLDVSPMIITVDRGSKRQRNEEEVLQVISFNSSDHGKVTNMNHILSMGEINQQQFNSNAKILSQSSKFISESIKSEQPNGQAKYNVNKIMKVFTAFMLLKQDLQIFKAYLADSFSNWELQALNTCKSIKEQMNQKINRISNQAKIKPLSRNLQMEEWSKRCNVLQQQILIVNKNLQLEKTNKENLKKENSELQQKLRKIQRYQQQQQNKIGSEETLTQQLKTKNKKLQYQLSQIKLQCQTQSLKTNKLKEVIKEREIYISSQGEELTQLQKKIKQLKIANEQVTNRERKYQIQIKSLTERIQRQSELTEKEISKSKMEILKFKNLLKTSQEQLSQCEEYINKLNNQMKEFQAQKVKLQQKIRQNEIQYYKKLQQCDKYLTELENHVKQLTSVNDYRQKSNKSKEMELFRMKQECQNKMMELNNKQYELQQIKKEYGQKIIYMQRRQGELKSEYNNAINAQNAVKDKWYQRYYSILSPEKQKNMAPQRDIAPLSARSPQRDVAPLSPRSSTRRQIFDIPIRQNKSPPRDKFLKVRSERNLNTYRSDIPISINRNETDRADSQKEIFNLGSRINSLRRELTKQLGQIGGNS